MFPTLGKTSKEQQSINALEKKINAQKDKLDKKLTRQKILLGAFFAEMLEKNEVAGLQEYTAQHLPDFLTREADRQLFDELIKNLGGTVPEKQEAPHHQNEEEIEYEAHTDNQHRPAMLEGFGDHYGQP